MKKLILTFTIFLSCVMTANAATTTTATTTNWDSAASLKRVNTIGQKLLTQNGLPTQVTFKVSDDTTVNAYANINKEIYVYKGLLQYVQNDDELAGVIGHELAHIIHAHCAKQTILSSVVNSAFTGIANQTNNTKLATTSQYTSELTTLKLSRNDEYEADLTGMELMMKAGYNPLAMVSVLNKICENSIDFLQSHPSGDKRVVALYDYLTYNYPAKAKGTFNTQSYKDFQTYMSAVNAERANSKKLQAKYEKTQKKLKAKRLKVAKKMRNTSNPWDTSYNMLQILSTSSESSS